MNLFILIDFKILLNFSQAKNVHYFYSGISKPPGKGLKTPAHQDNAYWCHSSYGGLTLWLSLDKAGRFNGMMKYGIGTNKKLLDHQLSTTTPGSSLIINESKLSNYSWFQPELNQRYCYS